MASWPDWRSRAMSLRICLTTASLLFLNSFILAIAIFAIVLLFNWFNPKEKEKRKEEESEQRETKKGTINLTLSPFGLSENSRKMEENRTLSLRTLYVVLPSKNTKKTKTKTIGKERAGIRQSQLSGGSPRFSQQPNRGLATKRRDYHLEELKPLRKMESPNFMSFLQLDVASPEMVMKIFDSLKRRF